MFDRVGIPPVRVGSRVHRPRTGVPQDAQNRSSGSTAAPQAVQNRPGPAAGRGCDGVSGGCGCCGRGSGRFVAGRPKSPANNDLSGTGSGRGGGSNPQHAHTVASASLRVPSGQIHWSGAYGLPPSRGTEHHTQTVRPASFFLPQVGQRHRAIGGRYRSRGGPTAGPEIPQPPI